MSEGGVRPTKWKPIGFSAAVVALVFGSWFYYLRPAHEAASVDLVAPKAAGEVGGVGSPRYNRLMSGKNQEDAEAAELRGHSYAPAVVGRSDLEIKRDVPPRQAPDCPTPGRQPPGAVSSQLMSQAMSRLLQATDLKPQQAVAIAPPKPVQARVAEEEVATGRRPLPEALKAGAVLYVVNDLRVSSDIPNVPVVATVATGPLRGARLTGRFQLAAERLVVQFTSAAHHGQEYEIDGLAIDPAIPAGDLASDVDHHYLLRWGSLLAGSFLEGLGATARSIAESGDEYAVTHGGVVVVKRTLDFDKQARITVGTMGERVGAAMQENFRTPTTVSLAPGQDMGVLILRAQRAQ